MELSRSGSESFRSGRYLSERQLNVVLLTWSLGKLNVRNGQPLARFGQREGFAQPGDAALDIAANGYPFDARA